MTAANVPARVIVPEPVIGPPEVVKPVVPPDTSTLVTVPAPARLCQVGGEAPLDVKTCAAVPVVPAAETVPVVTPPVAVPVVPAPAVPEVDAFYDASKIEDPALKKTFIEMQGNYTKKMQEIAEAKEKSVAYDNYIKSEWFRTAAEAEIKRQEEAKVNEAKVAAEEDNLLTEPEKKMKAKMAEHDAFIQSQQVKVEEDKLKSLISNEKEYPGFKEKLPNILEVLKTSPSLSYEQAYKIVAPVDIEAIKKQTIADYEASLKAQSDTTPGNYNSKPVTEKRYKGIDGIRDALRETKAELGKK